MPIITPLMRFKEKNLFFLSKILDGFLHDSLERRLYRVNSSCKISLKSDGKCFYLNKQNLIFRVEFFFKHGVLSKDI
jgi:hypothetical protein